MSLHIFLIIGTFGHPDISDGQLQGRIGIGQYRYPFIGMDGGGIVQVRADIDLFDANLRPPVTEPGWETARKSPRKWFPDHLPRTGACSAIFRDIFKTVMRRGHLTYIHGPPDMLGSPVPALPAIRIPDLQGITSHLLQKQHLTAVRAVHSLCLSVSVPLRKYGIRPIFFLYPFYFAGDDIGSLIPGNPLIFALAPVLGISFAVGVPVYPL